MASGSWVRATIFAACFALLIMVVAAHEGHEHTPGMAMAPQPEASKGNLVSLTTVIGFLALIVTTLVAAERV
ncbi:Uncharacterized protein TCM_010189 [Theobroma cacao]|uniref:Uncharacterized protein n=1 Tax=Theobroma cacao TaxID=3641 RepID=A0A061E6S2_THECC|nr:Uncharacterized protein TCM_010189 [Theobroma cacao]